MENTEKVGSDAETGTAKIPVQCIVMRTAKKLEIATLCRLMDDCLPDGIEDEKDMQKLIDNLWPALCCEFEIDA